MDEITDVRIEPCLDSKFVRPYRLHYKQNGRAKCWDFIQKHDSVGVLIYNTTREVFVIVKQFRPAMYVRACTAAQEDSKTDHNLAQLESCKFDQPASCGFTYELCAGIVDKHQPMIEIAKDEVLEECGYDVPLEKLSLVSVHCTSVGASGTVGHLFFAEVTDEMRVSRGGGNEEEGELIEVVEIPLIESQNFMSDFSKPKTSGLMFGFMWFHSTKGVH